MRKWLGELFRDERGAVSIKPVAAFICTVFLCGTMTANSFSHADVKPSDTLVNAVMLVALAGLGADSVDKFSKKAPADAEPEPAKPEPLNE